MKQITLMVVLSFMALVIAGNCESKDPPKPPPPPPYWKIDSVDTAGFTFTVSKVLPTNDTDKTTKSKSPPPPQKYTITAFTKVTISGKPGKFEDLKPEMKVTFQESGRGSVSRIDAQDPPAPKK